MSRSPFLQRKSPLGIPYALLILLAFFFLIPSAFRAARLSLEKKENNVKDWLPGDFPETAELEWFAGHFVGESFVLATWDGCYGGDQSLKLFEQKLHHESESFDAMEVLPPEEAPYYAKAKAIGNQLRLLRSSDDFLGWGGQKEKWVRTPENQWYYITPNGHLYRWQEGINAPAAAIRSIRRRLGNHELKGQLVTALGTEPTADRVNPYYNDPSLFCASLFHTVQTGESIVNELSREGGPLWPIDLTDEQRRPIVARRRAIERLTGTLFGPAVPNEFDWTPEAFRAAVTKHRAEPLPADFNAIIEQELDRIVDDRFDGKIEKLKSAPISEQTEVWYAVFDSAEIETPPRLTCVLVTLTDVAKETLAFSLGRGIMGQPRGRLLQLAAESGVSPAPAPSMAPPPFNREAPETVNGMPALRLGGPPVDNMAIDEEGTITLVRLVGYSVVLGIVLSYLCFNSVKITIMVFVVGGTAAMLSMAIVWWTNGRVDAILMSMPSLVYVLGLSGAIHVINYYRDEVRSRGETGAAGRALRHAFLPCTLASLTTAIGLISLFTSNLTPISNFGLYSAIGVMTTLGILFVYLPAALETFAPGIGEEGKITAEVGQAPKESRLATQWASAGRWITTHHAAISIACLAILLVGSFGLTKIKTSVQLLKLFDPDSRIIDDYAWLESNFGKLVPMELIVRMPPAVQASNDEDAPSPITSLDMIERVEAAARVRTVVYRTLGNPGRDIVGQATSADTFLPPVPAPSNGFDLARNKFNRDLVAASDTLRDNDYLRIEKTGPYAGSELWRISLRVAALSDVDYGLFISTLRESVEPIMRAYDTREVLLNSLTNNGKIDLPAKTKILMVGSKRPRPLEQAELIADDGSINTRNSFVATLGELLSAERIETPEWREVSAEQAKALVTNDKWERYVSSFDTVVWLGSDGFSKEDFAAAKNIIDAEAIRTKSVNPVLLADRVPDVEGAGPIQVVYTGLIPVIYKAQRTLLASLANSIGLAFVLIAGVMVFLLNPGRAPFGWFTPGNLRDGLIAGLIAMIPNIFPLLLVFGVMCYMGIEIDIGTMMTASVAMGVAVDDTIHFLSWFREYLDRGMNRVDAVIETYRRVGPAMTQTTVVGGLGLFVFALSTFTPTQRFGTLMLVMLATALVGDLILLPALLAGPAGRFFKPRKDARGNPINANPTVQTVPSDLDTAAEALPHRKVHFPAGRTDPPHRIK